MKTWARIISMSGQAISCCSSASRRRRPSAIVGGERGREDLPVAVLAGVNHMVRRGGVSQALFGNRDGF